MNSTFRKLRAFCRVLQGNRLWRVDGQALRTRVRALRTCVIVDYRDQEEDFCPLTFAHYVVTGEVWGVQHWPKAGDAFGFERLESQQIAAAADCTHGDKHQLKLRRIMEKACGIRKEP